MVSVIVPNYNHGRYLKERIDSILNQTYQDFELIILDDKSTDNSKDIIESYRGNPKISHIIYNEQNSGSTFKQWDKGFSLAKGDLIWIAESDDSAHETLLEKLVSKLEETPTALMAVSAIKYIDSEGNVLPINSPILKMPNDQMEGTAFIKKYMSFNTIIHNASSVVFRKSILNKIDKKFTTFKNGGDYLLWIEILRHGNIISHKEKLDYFRRHSAATTFIGFRNGNDARERKIIYEKLVEYKLASQIKRMLLKGSFLYNIKKSTSFYNEDVRKEAEYTWEKNLLKKYFCINLYRVYRISQNYTKKILSTFKNFNQNQTIL